MRKDTKTIRLVLSVVSVNNMAAVATRRDPYTGDTKKSMREGNVYMLYMFDDEMIIVFRLSSFLFLLFVFQRNQDIIAGAPVKIQ